MSRHLRTAFQFYNELDVLEIKLREIYDVVDSIVISESVRTHTGNPKPLYYFENRKRFEYFWPKIIHQVISDTPDDYINLSEKDGKNELHKNVIWKVMKDQFWPHEMLPYSRDAFEKESLIRAMGDLKDSDIVMIGDCDEVAKADVIRWVRDDISQNENEIYNLRNDHFWFYLNCLKEDTWIGDTILSFGNFKKLSMCELRKYRRGKIIENAGWHFSFQGDISQKIKNYGEQSINRNDVISDPKKFIESCITKGHNFYYQPAKFTIVEMDERMPQWLVRNRDKFENMIYKG
jgi:beta-1,4-mannosyl-glycoprotein beta-1,4-N-acetylglucosaminyltransferase